MNRIEFILVTSLILFVVFGLGWFSYWLLHRFTRVSQADIGELDRMAQALHDAETQRDQAIEYVHAREGDLVNRLTQAEAELRAAMDGLREARYEADQLRNFIEENQKT